MNTSSESSSTRLSSVASAIRILKAFSETEVELGISLLSQRLGLAKSTVHRLVSTLAAEGLLEQNEATGKYRLGLELFAMGALVRRQMNIGTLSLPYLHQLRSSTSETVHLSALDQRHIIYLYNLESDHAIRERSYIGARKPAYCSSEGRAMLAHLERSQLMEHLPNPLAPRTPNTCTHLPTLLKQLDQIAQQGYAEDDEETELGVRSLAAPIYNVDGRVIAAVGIAGPVQRLTKKTLKTYVPYVIETAQAISQRLGHTP